MIGSARAGTIAERHNCGPNFKALKCAHSRARPGELFFSLTVDWVENYVLMLGFRQVRLGNQEF
jgi:hypothetical protein